MTNGEVVSCPHDVVERKRCGEVAEQKGEPKSMKGRKRRRRRRNESGQI